MINSTKTFRNFHKKVKEYEEHIAHDKKLKEYWMTKSWNRPHEKRLIKLFEQANIQHLDEILEKIKENENNNQITLFQILSKDKEPDFYEKTIEYFLKNTKEY